MQNIENNLFYIKLKTNIDLELLNLYEFFLSSDKGVKKFPKT